MTSTTLFERYTSFVSNTFEKGHDFAAPILSVAWDGWQSWCADLGGRLDQPWQVVMAASVVVVLIAWRLVGDYIQKIAGIVLALALFAAAVTAGVAVLSAVGAWIDAHPILFALSLALGLLVGIAAMNVRAADDPWEEVIAPAGAVVARLGAGVWESAESVARAAAGHRSTRIPSDPAGRPVTDQDKARAAEVATLHEMFRKPSQDS